MGLLAKINRIYRSGSQMYQRSMKSSPKKLYLRAEIKTEGLLSKSPSDNLLIQGDNRTVIRSLIALSTQHIRIAGRMECPSI